MLFVIRYWLFVTNCAEGMEHRAKGFDLGFQILVRLTFGGLDYRFRIEKAEGISQGADLNHFENRTAHFG